MSLRRPGFPIISIVVTLALALALAISSFALAGVDERSITAPELPPLSECNLPASSQTLLSYGDGDSYFLAPGGSFEGPGAAGWYLADGARIRNGMLELPSGSQAVSPVVCVTVDCPHVRVFARSVTGGRDDVDFGVSYYRDGSWSTWRSTGTIDIRGSNWNLSGKLDIQPEQKQGFQQVRFAVYGGGRDKLFQLDDLWVDPRASR